MALSSIAFILVTLLVFYKGGKAFYRIYQNIMMGRGEPDSGPDSQRWRNMILVALGQKKMFKRPLPAILHIFIYVAFVLTQIELIEIMVDGVLGKHRSFADSLGWLYTLIIGLIEILSLLALIATVVFFARRNLLKLPRFWSAEMTSWPRLDANLILLGEFILVTAIFTMNGTDALLQKLDPVHYPNTGFLPVSGILGPAIFGSLPKDWLVWLERIGWWTHVLVVYGFILYLPVSKHLHIFLAFFNTYFARLRPRGEMANMPEIMYEVKSMLGLPVPEQNTSVIVSEFGAKDIKDLSWRTILGAYSCTECGRCTAVCPANLTGKKLSPRKIMMDIRDRTEEIKSKIESGSLTYKSSSAPQEEVLSVSNFDDGRSLFDYITKEEINACTTCNACVEACPVMIDPLDPILQLRRYQILTESSGPAEWLPMFNSLEGSGAVWQVPNSRSEWTHLVNQ